jgi:hypothetical protein
MAPPKRFVTDSDSRIFRSKRPVSASKGRPSAWRLLPRWVGPEQRYWTLHSWRGEDQIVIGGTGPDAVRMREGLEREEQRRERWLRRFRLL